VACEVGKTEAAVALLETPGGVAALDTPKDKGWTPVHIAAYFGRAEVLTHMLHTVVDLDLNRATDGGSTPLYLAAQQGCVEVVKQLCNVAASDRTRVDVNYRPRKGGPTPLVVAAKHGRVEVCDLLLKCGADINAETSAGVNAVHTAAIGRRSAVLRLLVDAGAHPLSAKVEKNKQ
jgi:ankyrin repeat protein